jgi:hypothetical protein
MVYFISNLKIPSSGSYWVYHKKEVDMSQVYQNPEEKLWLIVKNL